MSLAPQVLQGQAYTRTPIENTWQISSLKLTAAQVHQSMHERLVLFLASLHQALKGVLH